MGKRGGKQITEEGGRERRVGNGRGSIDQSKTWRLGPRGRVEDVDCLTGDAGGEWTSAREGELPRGERRMVGREPASVHQTAGMRDWKSARLSGGDRLLETSLIREKYSVEEKEFLTLGADRPIGRKDGQRGNRVNTQPADGKPKRYGRVDRGGGGGGGKRRYRQWTYDADGADRGIGGIQANCSVGPSFPHAQRIPGPGGLPQGWGRRVSRVETTQRYASERLALARPAIEKGRRAITHEAHFSHDCYTFLVEKGNGRAGISTKYIHMGGGNHYLW